MTKTHTDEVMYLGISHDNQLYIGKHTLATRLTHIIVFAIDDHSFNTCSFFTLGRKTSFFSQISLNNIRVHGYALLLLKFFWE